MNVLNKINKGLYEGEKAIAIVSFISMMGVMFLQVFFRYVIKSSIAWTEETMRYLFVISSFFGAACCTYEGKHVVIDFLGTILEKCVKNDRTRSIIDDADHVVVDVICTGFFVYISKVMFDYANKLAADGHVSSVMLFPLSYIGYGIALAFILCALHAFIGIFISAGNLSKTLKNKEGGNE